MYDPFGKTEAPPQRVRVEARDPAEHIGRWLLLLLLIAAMVSLATGCASEPPRRLPTWEESVRHKYLLEAGDTIQVRFTHHPELNDTLQVLPDGTLTLPMIGRVLAREKAPHELQAELQTLYAEHLVGPDITVTVREAIGQQIYVGGEVIRPGTFPLKGQMTVLHAVIAAGGINVRADGDEVILIRKSKEGRRLAFRIDLDEAIDKERSFQDIPLQPYDVVIVPKTFIAELNDLVLLYINNMVPQSVGFDYVIGSDGSDNNAFASSKILIGH